MLVDKSSSDKLVMMPVAEHATIWSVVSSTVVRATVEPKIPSAASAGQLQKVEVGRVLSWEQYCARAEQEGGRLPTTAELHDASIDVGYDQWTPITSTDGDQETGRHDGSQRGKRNAWANIGPRKYQIEFPIWGLDDSTHPWKHLTYFFVAMENSDAEQDSASSADVSSRSGVFQLKRDDHEWVVDTGIRHEINDKWNMYTGEVGIASNAASAAEFKFAEDGRHIQYLGDEFLGVCVNCHQFVSGASCNLLRTKNKPAGRNGEEWVKNSNSTVSPVENQELVLGFGKITYDAWGKKPQAHDSIGGPDWRYLMLVDKSSSDKLVMMPVAEQATRKKA